MSGNCAVTEQASQANVKKKRVEDAKKTYNLLGSVKYR